MASPLNIAFAGLGAMGFGMASHLVKLGHNVTGCDVYEPSLAKFREMGGRTASSPRQAAQGSDFLICMVANAQQAESVLFDSDNGAVQGMRDVSYPRGNDSDILQYWPQMQRSCYVPQYQQHT
jgi:3-hydroxyisobutyrate dehydrogenase-like beta-hydroxyacid dehydrogenase